MGLSAQLTIKALDQEISLGVGEQERGTPQRVKIDITYCLEIARSVQTDDLSETVDYAEIIEQIRIFCLEKEWKLLEKFTSDMADLILESSTTIQWVDVAVTKNVVPQIDGFSVKLRKQKS